MKILLVDDEMELTAPLSHIFTHEGYIVDAAYHGIKECSLAQTGTYDLLILDWILPGKTGLDICDELRCENKTTPVLFLAAKDTLDDRVVGLDSGADDYLVKPFELRDLLARICALLRRRSMDLHSSANNRLAIADLELDVENQVAYRQGRMIKLSQKESYLLQYLMEHPGQLLTHNQILQQLGQGEEPPTSNVVAALIRLLRRKIEVGSEFPMIHTVYSKGYRFESTSTRSTSNLGFLSEIN